MDLVLISLVAFAGSLLTFFSGFGLGTILLPVFALFYSASDAIALTGIVHLLNNVFKLTLIGRKFSGPILLKFGLPSMLGAFAGAMLLTRIGAMPELFTYQLGSGVFSIRLLELLVGILMIVFAAFELVPALKKLEFSSRWLVPGGLLSGFFGGLSGHQGALRSAFLVRSGLSKETFIATGVMIACLVDITRLISYSGLVAFEIQNNRITDLVVVILAAFGGALLGNYALKKITIQGVQLVVAIALAVIGSLLAMGIV